ncbi:MAG: ATP-binding protein [Bacteroidota bacterium]|nr:ATP-binding protein [Bacteroidota bacterium]
MNRFFKNKYFLLTAAFLLLLAAYLLHHPFTDDNSVAVSGFEKVLHKKEERLATEMLELATRAEADGYDKLFSEKPEHYNTLMQEDGLALLIYENDTLKFWSDNSIAVENWVKEVCLDTRMAMLRNGWFEVMRPVTNSSTTKTIVGLVLIKNEFPYQNNYLVNEFQEDFAVPAETRLLPDQPDATNRVINFKGEYLFSLQFNPANGSVSLSSYVAVLLNLAGFLFLVLFLQALFLSFSSRIGKNRSILLFVLVVVALRYISILFAFPESFYSFELFGPRIYADAGSIWLSSLGDLLINVILLFYLVFVILKECSIEAAARRLKTSFKPLASLLLFLSFFWFSWMITTLFVGLIRNSNIPFGINTIFSLNQYSYVGIIIIGLLLFVYFLFTDRLVAIQKVLALSTRNYILLFLFATAIHTGMSLLFGSLDLIIILWPFLLIVTIALIRQRHVIYPFSGIIFLVFLFSLYAVHVFNEHSGFKEMEVRKIYAEKIAAEQDPVAELLFRDIETSLRQDSVLMNYVNQTEKQPIEYEKRVKQQYFSGFWEKYDVRVALFDSMCVPVIKSSNITFDNNLYFDELISNTGSKTSSDNFYSLENATGKISYLAKIPVYLLPKSKQKFGVLYIELDAKFVSDEVGFPELLLDRNVTLSQELANYSYAKYKFSSLINHYGNYPYSIRGTAFGAAGANYETLNRDGFNHLLFRPDDNTLIVLSKKIDGLVVQVTTFSYLFAFFSLLLLSVLFFRQISRGRLLDNFSFKYRIQILLVMIVLVSLALFGGGTIYYIKQQFEIKNRENISEKLHSVLMEVEGKLGAETAMKKDISEYATFIMKKFSTVFFTDINLYDPQGNLFASSRSKVFDEGLTSRKMNPEAYLQIALLGKTEFVHDERIGKLDYLSAYIPFKNKDGKLLAYVNLPYFAKQSELEKEISGFLVALINIYVLLFALSIITAILISNYVTKPLKLIQDKLSNIKLGKTNELIDWQENDEIGSLVSEYNRMITELAHSAELLARSERESAWREMAKQVAHEIKNPLTPMKLSVQHLQRTWKDHAPDMDQKMERLTKTIIEQIDTLSTIATEFSNFAKMPKANLEQIHVEQILQTSIALFNNVENVKLEFTDRTEGKSIVMADREQLLRVFNNLLKNAIQAIPEERPGIINIELSEENMNCLISIRDNGNGIGESVIDKIFMPNFTTKNGGMGLGLAMVKSIVESCNGRIWFETYENTGTTFYVAIPSASED